MPESGGARAEIRALARTTDPAAITIGAGGRIVVQMRDDTLQILEFLPLENTSDKMFDPGPGAFEIPLPERLRGRAGPGQRTQGRCAAEPRHGRARPDRPQAFAADRDRQRAQGQRSGVRLRAALPWRHARLLTAGAERNRRPDPDHRPEGHRPHRQRPRRRGARGTRAGRSQILGHVLRGRRRRGAPSSSRSADCPRPIPAGAGSRAPSRWRWCSARASSRAGRPRARAASGVSDRRPPTNGTACRAARGAVRRAGRAGTRARARWTSPCPPISAASSSRGWNRFTRTSPPWTNRARHEPAAPRRKASVR